MGIIFEILFDTIVDVFFFYTGNFILFLVTLGRYPLKKTPFEEGNDNINKGPSIAVGIFFWIVVIVMIVYLLKISNTDHNIF